MTDKRQKLDLKSLPSFTIKEFFDRIESIELEETDHPAYQFSELEGFMRRNLMFGNREIDRFRKLMLTQEAILPYLFPSDGQASSMLYVQGFVDCLTLLFKPFDKRN